MRLVWQLEANTSVCGYYSALVARGPTNEIAEFRPLPWHYVTSSSRARTRTYTCFLDSHLFALSSTSSAMPRTKQRSIRRAKRRPPRRHAESAQTPSDTPTGSASTNAESGLTTASERKLSLSPHTASEYPSSVSSSETESESDGPKKGARILEVSGIQSALKSSERGKAFRKRARKKRKGIEDKNKEREGPVYVPGGFDCDPGPSKRARTS